MMINNNLAGGATADMATRNTRARMEKTQGYDEDISSHEVHQRGTKKGGGRSQLPHLVGS